MPCPSCQKHLITDRKEMNSVMRVPVCSTLDGLDKNMLVRIMIEPKNALIKQYQTLFKMENIELEFKNDALNEIAKMAIKRKTGARGLRSIMEDLLIDLMFEAPDSKDLKKIIINYDVVANKKPPIRLFSSNKGTNRLLVNKS